MVPTPRLTIEQLREPHQRLRDLVERQTKMAWRMRMGPVRSAFWWGIDIGTGLTTAVNYQSLWIFVLASLVVANPVGGIVLYMGYGLGRSALVWIGPALSMVARRGDIDLVPALMREENRWHRLHGTIAVAAAVIGINYL